jgi:hypothetical protein
LLLPCKLSCGAPESSLVVALQSWQLLLSSSGASGSATMHTQPPTLPQLLVAALPGLLLPGKAMPSLCSAARLMLLLPSAVEHAATGASPLAAAAGSSSSTVASAGVVSGRGSGVAAAPAAVALGSVQSSLAADLQSCAGSAADLQQSLHAAPAHEAAQALAAS